MIEDWKAGCGEPDRSIDRSSALLSRKRLNAEKMRNLERVFIANKLATEISLHMYVLRATCSIVNSLTCGAS
jgi:hypothetical protein